MTPLNAALLTLFANARHDIHLVTPNLTSWPVIDALLDALSRGINVQVRTGRNMMVIEQLITAGTTTSWCIRRFVKKYQALCKRRFQNSDPEAQSVSPGQLEILYYNQLGDRANLEDEPVFSHFKMTMVDGEYLVLGSGNLDRASWWTSQEIGVLFYMPGFRERRVWESVLEKRADVVFRSKD
jgi:phosphatidylserine/phosphatidylglycerophosphate/cardiolipin synthase-like enzyme